MNVRAKAFLGLAAVFLCGISLAVAEPASDCTSNGDWLFSVNNHYYDATNGMTVFEYTVTAKPGAGDLSHFTLVAPQCDSAIIADSDDWVKVGSGDETGFRRVFGVADGTTETVSITLYGEVAFADITALLNGAECSDSRTVVGPTCASSPDYGGPCPGDWVDDIENVECGSAELAALLADPRVDHTINGDADGCDAQTPVTRVLVDNNAVCSQVIYVVDTTAPTLSLPSGVEDTIYISCNDTVPLPGDVDVSDDCSEWSVSHCTDEVPGKCPNNRFITYTWKAVDDCGNEDCITQTIVVEDKEAPVLSDYPEDLGPFDCPKDINDFAITENITATDNCDDNVTVNFDEEVLWGDCEGEYAIVRTWSAKDSCDGVVSHTQRILVHDVHAPVWGGETDKEYNSTVECHLPAEPKLTAQDACAGNVTESIVFTPTHTGDRCPQEKFYTFTFDVCDDCGNKAETLNWYIHVNDTLAPTFDLPAEDDVTVECNEVPAQRAERASDSCDPLVEEATCTETRANSTCEHEYVLTRVCEACDACGNCAKRTRVVTVVDTNITCPAAPADASYQCNAIPAQAGLTAPAQRCPETLGQDFGERPYTPSCSYNIVRFWTFDDCADNTCTVEQTLSISDNIDPVFDSCPADTSAECHLPEAETLTATDNCSATVTVTHADVNETNECPGRRLVKRTYTADDGCSNTVDCVQYINVNDTLAPEWVSFPADEALLCSDEVVVVTPTANDDCSETTVIQVSDETVLHGCANNYTRTVTWKAVDQCGNTLGPRSQVIRVTDPDAPVLTEPLPEDKTDYCHDISCPDDVFATDNCDGLDLSYEEERIDFGDSTCDRLYELHRTWTATDDCGQTDQHTQVVTVSDPEAPVYNGGDLEDEEISCEDDIVLPTDPSTNWTDNCGDVTLVSITNTTSNTFECKNNVTVLVVWTVRDECGNTASVNKTYKVYDLTNPDIEDLDDTTFECDEDVVLEDPWHNDTCSNTILTATNVTTSLDCPTTGYLSQTVRNFTATDLCGNFITSSQVTRVTDTVDPTMECPPEVVFGTCCSVPPAAVLTATDNCAATQDVVAVETRQNGSCVNTYNLTYTWTAYDECRNFKQCVQTVVIVDDQEPTLEGVPTTDATAQCEDVPKPEHVCAHDNCGPLSLHFNETRVAGDCSASFTLRREWTAVDACGHDVTEGYNLVVSDENDPYWGALPSDATRECVRGASDPAFSDPSCTDNCTTTSVTPSSSQVTVGCVADIDFHFGWECVDECSNSITHNITVEQRDTTDPFFTWPSGSAPADASYDCVADEAETPEVGDSCTSAFLAYDNETELDVNASCPIQRSWVRVWNVTDECDHFVVHRQTVSINRPGTPFFTTTVTDSTIGCKDAVPAVPVVNAEDTCGNAISPVLVTTIENENCTELLSDPSEYDIVRTWTATDQCGQVVTLVQRISVRDMSPPTVTVPPARTLHNKCEQEPKLTGASHNDDCYSEIDCVDEDLNSGSCPYRFDIKTTFTATDNCGKQTSDSVQETYTFDLAPEVVNRSNISTHRTARCDNVETTPDVIAWVDGCGNDISGGELDTYVIEGDCPNNYTLVWNYSITDDCDLTSYFVIRTHVRDESAPVLHFEWPVQDELVECPFVSPAPEATATDSCGGDATIEFVEFKVGFDDSDPDLDCCNYDIYRVWKATDACGHSSTKTQKIQVQDTIPPQWTGPDIEDKDIVCPEVVERPNITWFEAPFAHGFCAGETESTNCTDSDAATYQFVLDGETYTLSNARFIKWVNGVAFLTGNATSGSTTYAVDFQFGLGNVSTSEGLAQSINNNTLKASCYDGSDGVVLAQWAFYETLQGNLTDIATGDLLEVSGGSYLQLGLGATGRNELYGLRTTLTATPEGGAAVDGELVLQLNDCNTSDWDLPELECGHELVTTEDETHDEECIGRYTHVFIWNATDPAGNTNSTTMTVTSDDLTPPTFFDLPASTDSGVCAEPPIPEIKAVDECSYANVSDVVNGTKMPFGPAECEYKYTRERTWTAIDDCLNDVDFVQTITVNDNVDPVITLGTKGTNKECFADLEPAATHSCSDNCGDANIASCTASDNTPAVPSNCDVTITYSYNAADDCGNTASEFYMVTVDDVSVPVCQSVGDDKLSCEDEDIRIPCEDGVPAKRNAVFLDNCDGELTVVPERTIVGDCPQVVTDLYEVADSCNNSAISFTKTYIIFNSESPVITTPANRTVGDCTSWEIPAEDENVTATDNCDGDLSVEHTGDTFTHDGDCLVLVTRHWRAVDSCGAITTAASYIIINDTTPPTFEPASIANEVINCTDDVPCPETVTITDGCDGVHLKYKETEVAGRCDNERVLIRTWTATDSCDNTATLSYNITIIDEIDPEWVGDLPVNETIECDEAPAGRTNLNATDSCGPATTVYNETRVDGSCPHEYQLVRTWVATDACDNTIDHSVTIHVNDTEKPTVSDLTDKAHECDRTVPEFDVPTFSDNCGAVSVSNTTGTVNNGCNGNFTVTNTWVGTDECGNSESVDQDIVVTDTQAPYFTSTPARVVNETCTNTTEPFPTFADDCSELAEITESSTDVIVPLDKLCAWPYRIDRSWTITDDCDHSATVFQTVNVVDSDFPSFTWEDDFAPEDAVVECDTVVPWTPVTASDPCEGDLTASITNTSTGTPDACDWTETRFWEVCDCSGNCVNHTQTIQYVDNEAPVFDAVPEAGPFTCGETIVLPNATANDPQCTGEAFVVTPTPFLTPGACAWNYTITATYFVEDRCGNNVTTTKDFSHEDKTPPVPDPVFNVTIECGTPVPEEIITCVDACDGEISSIVIDEQLVDDGDDCENTKLILQTYTCTDQCENSASVSRYVIVEDTTAPTIDEGTLPPNSCTECAGTPDEGLLAVPTPDLPFTQIGYIKDAQSGTGNCSHPSGGHGVVFNKWGSFNIDEDVDPTWRLFREGEGTEEFIKLDAEVTAAGAPSQRFQFSTKIRSVSKPGEPCESDRMAGCDPHFEFPFIGEESWLQCYGPEGPANQNEWVQYSLIEYGFMIGMGDCAGAEVTFSAKGPPFQMGFGANGKSIAYGGSAWIQWKLVSQAVDPSLCPIPELAMQQGDINIEMEPWDGRIIPNDCPDNSTLTNSTEIESGGCPANYTEVVTWTVTDCVGNSNNATRRFAHKDSTPPTISNITLPSKLECGDDVPEQFPVGTDICDGDVDVSGPVETGRTGDSCNLTITYQWTAEDECLNSVTQDHSVSFCDTTDPEFSADDVEISYECDEVRDEPAEDKHSGTDSCSTVSTDFSESTEQNGCEDNYTVTYTWTATDACGNNASIEEVHVVTDSQPPTIEAGEPECIVDSTETLFWVLPDITKNGVFFTASDACDTTPNITITSCTSDQDEALGVVPDGTGFSNHCFYVPEEDALYLRRSINQTDLAGRLYTVTGQAEDNCGHTDDVDRLFLISNGLAPFMGNDSSWDIRGLNITDTSRCGAAQLCVHMCPPCIYDVNFCAESDDDTHEITLGEATYDPSTDSTVFVYVVTGDASRVTLGLNLAEAELLSLSGAASDAQRFGFQRNSYFAGVSWSEGDEEDMTELSFVLKGNWTSEEDNTPYEIKWDTDDDSLVRVASVPGPCKRSEPGTVHISGTVGVSGTVYGDREDDAVLSLGGIVVKLQEKTLWSPETYAYTMTAADGSYSFTNLNVSEQYQVVIDEEGFLEGALQGAHRYLTTDTNALVNQYGEPRCVPTVPATDANLNILIDELKWDTEADRARYLELNAPIDLVRGRGDTTDTNFNGNAKSVGFWTEQYRLSAGGHLSLMTVDAAIFGTYSDLADALLVSFGASASDLLTSGSVYQQRVAALALNHYSGFGVLRPFRELQTLVLNYAVASGPAPTTEATISAMLLKMLSAN